MAATERVLPERACSQKRRPPESWGREKVSYSVGGRANYSRFTQLRSPLSALEPSSFKMWRARVQGRSTKHSKNRSDDVERFRCSRQRNISNNKLSKR